MSLSTQEEAATELDLPPGLPRLDLTGIPPLRVTTRSVQLLTKEAHLLGLLSTSARRVRNGTARTASSRQNAQALDDRLAYHRARGVPVQDLARATGLTARAIRFRLPETLPERPLIQDSPIDTPNLLLIWPTSSQNRKWRTLVTVSSGTPVALPTSRFTFAPSTAQYHVLTPEAATHQLGWFDLLVSASLT